MAVVVGDNPDGVFAEDTAVCVDLLSPEVYAVQAGLAEFRAGAGKRTKCADNKFFSGGIVVLLIAAACGVVIFAVLRAAEQRKHENECQ